MDRTCPRCGSEMELVADEPDVGIVGGWECTNEQCGHMAPYEGEDPDVE